MRFLEEGGSPDRSGQPERGDRRRRLLSRADLLRSGAATLLGTLAAIVLGDEVALARRVPAPPPPSVAGGTIMRCVIHPGIGIARVGNSPTGYFIGPEVPGVTAEPDALYKDAQGRIKRQVARFRLYGLNAAGQVVRELTSDDAAITWTVHLANKKAAWYRFGLALDIPEALAPHLPAILQPTRRNPNVRGRARGRLVIDPGKRSIKGKLTQGRAHHFDSGSFLGKRVSLGELRTDDAGNLLVFSGLGKSSTPLAHNPPTHIANNDGWHDDVSDGPVTATVVFGGRKLPVTPAWVIAAPPKYAPDITPVVTLYDIAYQAYLDAHPPPTPLLVSFMRDIYPIFARFDRLQWVNQGFFEAYGWQGQVSLLDPTLLAQLASSDPSNAAARQSIFNRFRDPSYPVMQEDAWPRLYGDNFAQPPESARQYLAVTPEQYRRLGQWASGSFTPDWNPGAPLPANLNEIPLADRPAALDRAAPEACSGGPFHPGIEATWVMRQSTMYSGLFRLRARRSGDPPEPNYGHLLTPQRALGSDGPLHRSGPGDITRWMAVPWQTDAANCGSAYPHSTVQPYPLPDLPSFWPAAVPNRVLTEQAYQRILDSGLDPAARRAAFQQRLSWARHLPAAYLTRNKKMITAWTRLGFIVPQPGSGDPALPPQLYVETESGFPETATAIRDTSSFGLDDRRARM